MNKHKSNKIKENSNTVTHLIMGQIITTQNLVAIKEVRHAGQLLLVFISVFIFQTNGDLQNTIYWNSDRFFCFCFCFSESYSRSITVTPNERHGIFNGQQLDYLFNRLFRLTANKATKAPIIGSLWGESIMTGGFRPHRASDTEGHVFNVLFFGKP